MPRRSACLLVGVALGLACDPDSGSSDLCRSGGLASARFYIDLYDFPVDGPDISIDAACAIGEVAGVSFRLDCPVGDVVHQIPVNLILDGTEDSAVLKVGDAVEFHLRRDLDETRDQGMWTVRRDTGELMAGGIDGDSVTPTQTDFFAPLQLSVDDTSCPEVPVEDTCFVRRRHILIADDGTDTVSVTAGFAVDLDSGLRVQVGHATRFRPSDASCTLDEELPHRYRLVILATK